MEVFFEVPGKPPYCIEVGYSDTILNIKERVEKYMKIPVSTQTLIFQGKVLEDHIYIQDSDVRLNSRVQVVIHPQDSGNPSEEQRNATPKDATSVKDEPEGVGVNDRVPLAELTGKRKRSPTLSVPPKVPKKTKVTLMKDGGKQNISVKVNLSENVEELRKEIEKVADDRFSLPNDGYFFIHKQNVMDDKRSFKWHRVGPGDTIEIFGGSVSSGF